MCDAHHSMPFLWTIVFAAHGDHHIMTVVKRVDNSVLASPNRGHKVLQDAPNPEVKSLGLFKASMYKNSPELF